MKSDSLNNTEEIVEIESDDDDKLKLSQTVKKLPALPCAHKQQLIQ